MLEEIRIRGLGVIDDAVLELAPGLTVVTGETGAGKTMVVSGIGLLLGARADTGAVNPRAGTAVVEGRLTVPGDGPVAARVKEAGGALDDGALIVSRTVTAEGRSRAHVGGRAVPAAVLAELSEELVTVHGQHDQMRLRRPASQRAALDRYAGAPVLEPLAAYTAAYERLRDVQRRLAVLRDDRDARRREAEHLRTALDEVAALAPQPGEDLALRAEEDRLAHAETLREAAGTAHAALLGDPADGAAEEAGADVSALLAAARRALGAGVGHDPALGDLANRLDDVGYLVADLAADLASYAASVEGDPARLAAVQDRRAALGRLARRYGDPAAPDGSAVDALRLWAEAATARLAELDVDDDAVAALAAERAALRERLATLAAGISRARTAAAHRLSAAVTAELDALAMAGAALVVAVTQRALEVDGDALDVDGRRLDYGADGVDTVELLLAPHPGAPARPVHRGASGGELSRVMLALEVVLAGVDPVPTFVFDEVDAGVGGRAAAELGRRLARLAETAQVVVVTHLPQVAAFADRHLTVVKETDGSVTASGVVELGGDARLREISRMLAGVTDSAAARAHAEELLTTARGRVGP